MDLTDEQWEMLEPLIPDPPRREDGRGRPWRDPRDVLNGILWILRTGAPWKDLPERYPPYQTCHRRFQKWIEEGVLSAILEALALDLEERAESKKRKTKDGRKLRRYKRRWKIERLFAWLQCLATELQEVSGPPRVQGQELPGHGAAWVYRDSAQKVFMRWLLVSISACCRWGLCPVALGGTAERNSVLAKRSPC